MRAVKTQAYRGRLLHRGHFAFMRAVVQGLDLAENWDRYLRVEGDHSDIRLMRRTIFWIKSEFAAAARRESRPGTARLVLLDSRRIRDLQPALPSLTEFAEERGLEDFSEAEQSQAFAVEYGGPSRRLVRRARFIERQIAALNWLEDLVAQNPSAGDGVAAWLAPKLASYLERAGLPTLFTLVERINGVGSRWWSGVRGIGELKASRIVNWLREHERSIGMTIGSHALQRQTKLSPASLLAVVPSSTALVPIEKFIVPNDLDGRTGRFRAPPHQCLLRANNDYEAIAAWLSTKKSQQSLRLSPTQRSYRKEAERLLLWSILEQGKPLSSLATEDAIAYRDFLLNPPQRWRGSRYRKRWSPFWRPLEGPLSAPALAQAITILRTLYSFLISQNYVVGNPFTGISLPVTTGRTLGSSRTLSFADMEAIEAELKNGTTSATGRRLARAVRWLYATGLRLSEIVQARCGDLERLDYTDSSGRPATGWLLTVIGKGHKMRKVPVPQRLVDELCAELCQHGLSVDPMEPANAQVPILARFGNSNSQPPLPWTTSGLSKFVKALMLRVAKHRPPADAQRIRRASTHWLRHSHGSHALQGRAGHPAVPLQVVQNNLGHASIGTTSGYLTTEAQERLRAMQDFWVGSA